MITLRDIDVVFHDEDRVVTAVKDVNLDVEKGEIYGIVGYSGAGKSTLVRTINLLQRPTNGSVLVNGQDLMTLKPHSLRQARKKIGMIFQHFNLMESRTIFDNVAYPLKGSGLNKKEKAAKVAELLDLVGLKEKTDAYPKQLSGGQKQRVAIARALANDPDILLCDEATSALDPKTTSSILDLLRELNEKLGLTIVIITHEMSVVKDLCHKVAVMEDGRILEQGPIVDIFTEPTEHLTKEFIDTATHFDQEMAMVLAHPETQKLNREGILARLSYVGVGTTQPLISTLVRDFDVTVNIIYGHVEILQNIPVGNLLVAFTGDQKKIQDAIDYLRTSGVKVDSVSELLEEYVTKED
ncbi:methionine ABC transporter ATP-binding protein [Fundicoccus sp. Sow4_F4]|uniref:methionine ABC transporter ATP-binding protein n=1 Tax=Fundicoccus sp. Sow4_F4 TaxID=3438783 RepID=UPI003F8F677C